MKRTLALLIAIVVGSPAFAIVGCLTAEAELSKRAQVVAIGSVAAVARRTITACPPRAPSQDPEHDPRYSEYLKCGAVRVLTVHVSRVLRGNTPHDLEVFVSNEGPLRLTCDDRPEPEKMVGTDVVLFLESDAGRLWTLDGPDSLYSSWPKQTLSREEITRLSAMVGTAVPPRSNS
jgi:hypothetical protein